MLDTSKPMAVRFVVPDAAVGDLNAVLEASEYIVTSTFEPNIFQRGFVVASIERPGEPVHGEFVNYAAIGIWNRPRQWCRQA